MKEYKYITNELINKGEVTITKYDSLLCKEVSDYNEHMVICREKKKELDKIQEAIDAAVNSINTLTSQIHNCDDEIATLDNIISGHIHVSEKTAR